MFPLNYRESLPPGVLEELEGLTAGLKGFLSVDHNEDGSHRFGTWTTYPLLWTSVSDPQPSLGNGGMRGSFARIGRTIFYQIALRVGSTTTLGTSAWVFNAPLPVSRRVAAPGNGYAVDVSTGAFYPVLAIVALEDLGISLADANGVWDATTPITWDEEDYLIVSGFYELSDAVA